MSRHIETPIRGLVRGVSQGALWGERNFNSLPLLCDNDDKGYEKAALLALPGAPLSSADSSLPPVCPPAAVIIISILLIVIIMISCLVKMNIVIMKSGVLWSGPQLLCSLQQ